MTRLLEDVPPHPERPGPEILPARVEAVERDQRRGRGGLVLRPGADPLKVRKELAVEDRDLAVEQERRRFERGYEGLVGKDEASAYVEGRTLAWLKVKVPHYREGERGWEAKRQSASAAQPGDRPHRRT